MAIDRKRRTVLSDTDIPMVGLTLANMRHENNQEGILKAVRDVREVLEALSMMGHAIVEQGWLDEIKKGISKYDL